MVGRILAACAGCTLALGCGSTSEQTTVYLPPECTAGRSELPVAGCEAGIPADRCAQGFEGDGNMGCRPILPEMACADGLLAVPGESRCRELVACGSAPWGDAPVDGASQFVDASYAGGDSDGSAQKPWTSIGAAVLAASAGQSVVIAAGSYAEDLRIDKPLRLFGRCPSMVEIVGSASALNAAVEIAAAESELHALSVTGESAGIFVSNALDVRIDGVWVHDTAGRGIAVQSDFGPASITLENSVVERATLVGLHVVGSSAVVAASSLRGIVEDDPYATGYGLSVQPDATSGAPSSLELDRSVLELNHTASLLVVASTAAVQSSVVRDTQPSMLSARDGVGILVIEQDGAPAELTLEGSVLARNHARGLALVGSLGTVGATHVHDTAPQEWDANTGEGIAALASGPLSSTLALSLSTVERNHSSGVFVQGSHASFDGVLVRDTEPRASDGAFGRGIAVVGEPAEAIAASASLEACLLEQNHAFGLWIAGGSATVSSTMIRGTEPQPFDGEFGDGIALATLDAGLPASIEVHGTRAEDNARAGLALHGAQAEVASSSFECNALFDLLGLSSYFGTENPFSLDDAGDNACGCGTNRRDCAVVAP